MTRTERTWTAVAALLGAAALVGGLAQLRVGEVSFGWFAYAPLAETVYAPAPGSWRAAALVALAGALVLGGAAGFALGRRGRRDDGD